MRIACIGFGIDPNRTEAVSINTLRFIQDLEDLGHEVVLLNIGHAYGISFSSSMKESLVNRKTILENLRGYIVDHAIEVVIDVFVLPLSSVLFTIPLQQHFPNVVFIKEIHNPPGFSNQLHFETIIRLVANNSFIHGYVTSKFGQVFTRNSFLANAHTYLYLPSKVEIHPFKQRIKSHHRYKIGYIGHPLVKKGVSEFLDLIEQLPIDLADTLEFHFAFSNVGDTLKWEQLIKKVAHKKHVDVFFHGKVKPWQFLRKVDMYLLPIHDNFGAISTPNTVLEAMEAGALVMVTNINSLKGIIEHERNGILLDSYRANYILPVLQKVLYDDSLRAKLVQTARQDCIRYHAPMKVKEALKRLLWQKKMRSK